MNEFFLKKEHIKLRNRIREFAEQIIKPEAKKAEGRNVFSEYLTKKMGSEGLFGMLIPKKYGGHEMDTLSYIIAVEELARVDSSQAATIAAHNSLGIAPIFEYGTEEQKQKYLPQLCTGKKLWAFGLTEPNSGSDIKGVETYAKLENKMWKINGSKIFISNAASKLSVGVTILAITGNKNNKKELSTILIEKSTDGYKTEPIKGKLVWNAADTGKIFFTNCKVPEKNMLGERGKGINIMLKTLDAGRLSIAAIGLGLSQGAFELALNYAKKRKQFGKSIASFQVNSFKLADMALKLELARNTLYKTCWLKDNHKPFATEASMIKLYCSEIAKEIADEALQIHGAYGLIKENDIERFYRDQRLLQIGEGTSEILRVVIAKNLGIE